MSDKVQITGLNIDTKQGSLTLDMVEAKELWRQLDDLFGSNYVPEDNPFRTAPITYPTPYPYPIIIERGHWPWSLPGVVWCESSVTAKSDHITVGYTLGAVE